MWRKNPSAKKRDVFEETSGALSKSAVFLISKMGVGFQGIFRGFQGIFKGFQGISPIYPAFSSIYPPFSSIYPLFTSKSLFPRDSKVSQLDPPRATIRPSKTLPKTAPRHLPWDSLDLTSHSFSYPHNPKPQISNLKLPTSNFKQEISDLEFESQISDLTAQTWDLKSQTTHLKSQNLECQIPRGGRHEP